MSYPDMSYPDMPYTDMSYTDVYDTEIIKIGILHPLGACGTTEKMLVTCHASSEQVPPMTPTTAEGQLQSDPWSQHRD